MYFLYTGVFKKEILPSRPSTDPLSPPGDPCLPSPLSIPIPTPPLADNIGGVMVGIKGIDVPVG